MRREGESEPGHLTCLADAEYLTGQEGPLSLMSWHSGGCRRIARSSLSAEAQAVGEAQEEGRTRSARDREYALPRCEHVELERTGALVLHCEALFDGVSRSESGALGFADKRSALEAMALKISFSATKTRLYWVHSEAQLADVMTKSSGPGRNILKNS